MDVPHAVAAGDRNDRPDGRTFGLLAGALQDGWATKPWGREHTTRLGDPLQRAPTPSSPHRGFRCWGAECRCVCLGSGNETCGQPRTTCQCWLLCGCPPCSTGPAAGEFGDRRIRSSSGPAGFLGWRVGRAMASKPGERSGCGAAERGAGGRWTLMPWRLTVGDHGGKACGAVGKPADRRLSCRRREIGATQFRVNDRIEPALLTHAPVCRRCAAAARPFGAPATTLLCSVVPLLPPARAVRRDSAPGSPRLRGPVPRHRGVRSGGWAAGWGVVPARLVRPGPGRG